METQEIWKDIPGYEGLYQASTLGMVKNLSRYVNTKWVTKRPVQEKILKPQTSKVTGYCSVAIQSNRRYLVHRLVGLTFIDNPQNKPCINHKDGNKLNNCVDNLEWATYSENSVHSYENKLQLPVCGEKHGLSKLNNKIVSDIISLLKEGKTLSDISIKTGVDKSLISNIKNKRNWKHLSSNYNHVSLGKGNIKLTKSDKEYILNNAVRGNKGNIKYLSAKFNVCRKTILNFLLKNKKNEHLTK